MHRRKKNVYFKFIFCNGPERHKKRYEQSVTIKVELYEFPVLTTPLYCIQTPFFHDKNLQKLVRNNDFSKSILFSQFFHKSKTDKDKKNLWNANVFK